MIFETVLDVFFNSILLAFSAFDAVNLPLDAINVLGSFLSYGIWVVGLDLISIFVTVVVFWWSLKFAVGLVVWIWELLPMT